MPRKPKTTFLARVTSALRTAHVDTRGWHDAKRAMKEFIDDNPEMMQRLPVEQKLRLRLAMENLTAIVEVGGDARREAETRTIIRNAREVFVNAQ